MHSMKVRHRTAWKRIRRRPGKTASLAIQFLLKPMASVYGVGFHSRASFCAFAI